jgi:hypothetical protein
MATTCYRHLPLSITPGLEAGSTCSEGTKQAVLQGFAEHPCGARQPLPQLSHRDSGRGGGAAYTDAQR